MLNLAMNAGILGGIKDAIVGIVEFFANFVDIIKGIFQALTIYAFSIFYYLFMGICSIVNFAEMLFKKFAGIDPIMTTSGEPMNILDVFVKSYEIWGLYVSIVVLSIVLLFLFTIVAVIKSEFALDAKGSAKGPIIARSLKSLAMFFIVPAASLIGTYAVNAITDTVNSMMQGSDRTTMVNQIFYAMTYNANKARINKDFAEYIAGCPSNSRNNNGGAWKGSQDSIAYNIDMAFKSDMPHKSGCEYINMKFPMEMLKANDFSTMFLWPSWSNWVPTYSVWDINQVNFYFSILDFDYVVGFGSAIVITYMLLSMSCVLIKRIFEMVILLLLAAPMVSLAPLDGGAASKKWQGEYIKRAIAIVAPVFAINMYFIMIPLFQKIALFSGPNALGGIGAISMSAMGNPIVAIAAAYVVYDILFQLLVICVGMSVVKTASALLCNLLGIQDLLKEGHQQTKEGIKKVASTAVAVAGAVATGGAAAGAMGAMKAAGGAAKMAGKAVQSSQKNVSAAKSKLANAKTPEEKEKAQAELDKAEGELKENKAKHDTALQDQAKAKKLWEEKRDDAIGATPFKGLLDAKKTWKNKGKTKDELADKEELEKQERSERIKSQMEENKKQNGGVYVSKKDAEAKQEREKAQAVAEMKGSTEAYYEPRIEEAKKDVAAKKETEKGARKDYNEAKDAYNANEKEIKRLEAIAHGEGNDYTDSQRRQAQRDMETAVGNSAGLKEAMDKMAVALENATKERKASEKNLHTLKGEKHDAMVALDSSRDKQVTRDGFGNANVDTEVKSRGQIAGQNAVGMAIAGAGSGGLFAAGQIVADAIENKQIRSGNAALDKVSAQEMKNSEAINQNETSEETKIENAKAEAMESLENLDNEKEEVKLDTQELGEGVQQGLNEAMSALKDAMKSAMEGASLKVQDIKNISAQIKAIQAQMKLAGNADNKDRDAMLKEISKAIADLAKKLK